MTRAALADLLGEAQEARVAIPACSVYTLDQAAGVIDAAQDTGAPVILQVHPQGIGDLLAPLLVGLGHLADTASIRAAVCLDHCDDVATIRTAIDLGVDGVMADGSALATTDNASFVRLAVEAATPTLVLVEAELGRLSGTEDGLTVDERVAAMTDPDAVPAFLAASGAGALAVCIGNVHGSTGRPPVLDVDRLARIRERTDLPLVLHGATGIGADALRACVDHGVVKVNLNTELRNAYARSLSDAASPELATTLRRARGAVAEALRPFFDVLRTERLAAR